MKRSTFEKRDHRFSTQELTAAVVPSRDLHKTKPVKASSTGERRDQETPPLAGELPTVRDYLKRESYFSLGEGLDSTNRA